MKKIMHKILVSLMISTILMCHALITFAAAPTTQPAQTGQQVCETQNANQSCVVAPTIPKPDTLPGPSPLDNAGNMHEKYFITDLIPTLIRGGINLLGAITVVILMYAGITYMIAYGDDTKIDAAKNMIKYSLLGLLLAMFSYTIISLVGEIPLSSNNDSRKGVSDQITSTQFK